MSKRRRVLTIYGWLAVVFFSIGAVMLALAIRGC